MRQAFMKVHAENWHAWDVSFFLGDPGSPQNGGVPFKPQKRGTLNNDTHTHFAKHVQPSEMCFSDLYPSQIRERASMWRLIDQPQR